MLLTGVALAQSPNSTLPSPRVNSVFPCGGQVGKSFEVNVRGTELDEPQGLTFSHRGITAKVIVTPEPATKKGEPAKAANKSVPANEAKFTITIAKDVPPGTHEVRFVGQFGVSNPRAFVVGTRPEQNETEPNSDVPEAQKIELGSVVNGVISATTDVDYFIFTGRKGQRILAHCAASSIDSRSRPFVELFASDGASRLGINRNDTGNDALCDVTLPADAQYYLRISEFAYTAGGEDYFYRLSVSDGPWLDAIYPPMIEAGKIATVTLIGRNLKDGKPAGSIDGRPLQAVTTTITAPKDSLGFAGLAMLPQTAGLLDGFAASPLDLNARPLFFATAPVVLETQEPNDTIDKSQAVPTPVELAGCIFVRNDRDAYRFTAKRGEPVMIELFAERIGTTLDAVLSLHGPDGKEIAANAAFMDDDPEALHPTSFFNRTTDPAPFRFTPTVDGVYTVTVSARDSNANFGPRTIYRLRIVPPQPDFRVVVMPRNRDLPSGVTVTSSGETAIDVFVQRLDGFSGPVTATIENLPAGVTAKPAMIGTDERWGLLVLNGGDVKDAETMAKVVATATIRGKLVTRAAQSASITWDVLGSQNAATIARLDRGLLIATRKADKRPYRISAKLDKATIKGSDGKERPAKQPFEVKAGEKINVPVVIEWQGGGARPNVVNLNMEPTSLNQNNRSPIAVNNGRPLPVAKDKNEAVMVVEAKNNTAPGYYNVNLIGETKVNMSIEAGGKQKKDFTVLAYAAPFSITVLPTTLAKLSQTNATVKLGKSTPLTVRVERLFDFEGEYKVRIAFPEKCGLQARDAVIPAGSNEVKIEVDCISDAKPGRVNATIEATALFDDKYKATSEAKAVITITK